MRRRDAARGSRQMAPTATTTTAHRLAFTVPFSILTHNLYRAPVAHSWLVASEPERGLVHFLADTPRPTDWRYVALQMVHELSEAVLHHHIRVTEAQLLDRDLDALDTGRPAHDPAHTQAATLETLLSLALSIDARDYASAIHGRLVDLRRRPAEIPSY